MANKDKNKLSYKNYLKTRAEVQEKRIPTYKPKKPFIRPLFVSRWGEQHFKEMILHNFNNKRFRLTHEFTFIDQEGSYILFSFKDDRGTIHHFVRVRDSSTGAYHLLRVPKEMSSCLEAIAWTFGMNESDYVLLKET